MKILAEMKILVCGSRGLSSEDDYRSLCKVLNSFCAPISPVKVIHGACPNSPDMLADRWADEHSFIGGSKVRYPANWERDGSNAGFLRNTRMVESSPDLTVALWDGKSRGTLDTIRKSVKAGIPVRIIPCQQEKGFPRS